MNCEDWRVVTGFICGRLSSDLAGEVEKHLAGCAACGEEAALWKDLASLPEEQPSQALQSRFKAMLESYQEGRWEKTSLAAEKSRTPVPMLWGLGNWRQLPAAGIVWACLFLACGYFIGKHAIAGSMQQLRRRSMKCGRNSAPPGDGCLSMLQQQSASQRLEGGSWSTRLPEPDPKVLGALQHTLHFDNSVDVSLAALDALSPYAGRPEVRRELVTLQNQQSPLVQIALIDLLVDLHDKNAVSQFKRVQQDPKVDPTVKKRVDWNTAVELDQRQNQGRSGYGKE
jgi:hypothetical protein